MPHPVGRNGEEWEHACRAGTTGPRYGELDEIGWYRGNSHERIHEVGGKRPNFWAFTTCSATSGTGAGTPTTPRSMAATGCSVAAGGWFDEHWSCRASARRRSHPAFQVDDVGFRVARSVMR